MTTIIPDPIPINPNQFNYLNSSDIENLLETNTLAENKNVVKPVFIDSNQHDYYLIISKNIASLFNIDITIPLRTQRIQYRICTRENTSNIIILLTTISYLIYFITLIISINFSKQDLGKSTLYLNYASAAFGLASSFCGLLMILSKSIWKEKFIYIYETVFYIGIVFSLCLHSFSKCIYGSCLSESNGLLESMICNTSAQLNMIPEFTTILLLATPLIYQCTIRSILCEIFAIGMIISYFWVVFLIIYMKSILSIPFFLTLTIFIIAAANLRYKDLSDYASYSRGDEVINLKNEKNEAISLASELRMMIANVSHDLKTPLASFLSGAELISLNLKDAIISLSELEGDAKMKVFESISTAIDTSNEIQNINSFMLMTINRCIEFAKTSKGIAIFPTSETIDLLDCIRFPITCMESVQTGKSSILLKDISLGICPYVITDKLWLQESILCLLSNAVKYSSKIANVTIELTLVKRSSERSISVSSSSEPKSVSLSSNFSFFSAISYKDLGSASGYPFLRIEVEDTGIGIEEDKIKSLFLPFKQGQRLSGGTGLGLYSLRRRIDALRGFYGVSNRKDGQQGSLFWFEIPYKPDNEMAVCFKAGQRHSSLRASRLREMISKKTIITTEPIQPMNILLVDDSLPILKMTSNLLKRDLHTIDIAENGEEAVKKYIDAINNNTNLYDVVLMDFQMPIMDGLEATKRIRHFQKEKGDGYHQLIIGCSANSDQDAVKEAMAAGMDFFLPKPFNIKNFYAIYPKK